MSKICLYHADHPKGKIFKLNEAQEQFEELKEAGWLDSPARLALQKEEPEPVAATGGAENLHPEDLIGMVKEMGFKVLTEEQLEAEINKYMIAPMHIEDFEDAILKAEYENRFGNIKPPGEDNTLVKLMARFDENPEALNKE
ncbi:MAG: hypothetical protein RPT25_03715, partial [Cycloclasticus sp.]